MTTNERLEQIETSTKKFANGIIQKVQVYGFWCLLILSLGIFMGMSYNNKTKAGDIATSIKLGGFVHDGKVYDIKIRPIQ